MATTTERMRAWNGPALFGFGFRPFFLGAGVWAALAMTTWVAMLSGVAGLPTAFDPVSWHAHEFLYGYLGAVVAGFMMTAVPNWTGRMPIVGWPLAGLFGLWLLGRVAVAASQGMPPLAVAAADLSFMLALLLAMAREIVAGRNWRNLAVVGLLAILIAGNALFHWDAARGGYAAQGAGLRLGLAAALLMIALIGGRIVPSFTRNWLAKRGAGRLPVPPMQRFDKVSIALLVAALAAWVAVPAHQLTGAALVVAGAAHLVRLARWCGDRTGAEPLVWVLHLGYLFLPLGALAQGAAVLWPAAMGAAAAQHVWMAGAIGLMTLAVMTRATLGHSGQALTAGPGTTVLYLLVAGSVLARLAAGVWPDWAPELHALAGGGWILGFAGFAVLYGGLLIRPRATG